MKKSSELVSYEQFEKLGVTLAHAYVRQLVRLGKFPQPVSARKQGIRHLWRSTEIDAWVKEKTVNRC